MTKQNPNFQSHKYCFAGFYTQLKLSIANVALKHRPFHQLQITRPTHIGIYIYIYISMYIYVCISMIAKILNHLILKYNAVITSGMVAKAGMVACQ